MRSKTILTIFTFIVLPPLFYLSVEWYLGYTFDQKCDDTDKVVVHDDLKYHQLIEYAQKTIPSDKYFAWSKSPYRLEEAESENNYGIIEQTTNYSIGGKKVITMTNYKLIIPALFDSSGLGDVKIDCHNQRANDYPEYLIPH